MRRTVGGVATLAITSGLMVGVPTAAWADDHTTPIALLNINDFHGRIDGNTVKVAGTIEQLRAQHGEANTVFLSAGDNIGASLFASSVQQDSPTIDVLNALGLAASAVGNHEFDAGFDDLSGRVADEADFPYLGANVYDADTGSPVLDEYALVEVGGLTVGVIGAVTEETPSLVSPAGVAGLEFGDPVEAVNRVAEMLSDGVDEPGNPEADVLVAQYHEGANVSTSLADALAASAVFTSIVEGTHPEVDAIFNGHTHATYAFAAPVGDGTRPVVQTGSYGSNIGEVVLTVETATGDVLAHTQRNVARTSVADATLVETYPRVAEVETIVDAALAVADEVGSEVVGEISADITTAFFGGQYVNGEYFVSSNPTILAANRDDRSRESTLGNFVANVLRDTVAPNGATAEIGVVNPGGLRAELYYSPAGTVTLAEANAVLPFVNNVWFTTLTGAQFVELLNQQWQTNADGTIPSRSYLQLGLSDNVTYVADPTAPRGERIVSVTVGGEPIDLEAEYRISSFSFLVQGGDNFRVFQQGTDTVDTGLVDRDVWFDALRTSLDEGDDFGPDFRSRSLDVTVPAASGFPVAGQTWTFQVSGADLTSLGSPLNTELEVSLNGEVVTSAEFVNGVAEVDLAIPDGAGVGPHTIGLEALPSGTVAEFQIEVSPFADVPLDNQFADAIQYVVDAGIAEGYADGTFRPVAPVSRQAMAAFLFRQANPDSTKPLCTVAPFPDVPVGSPFCGEITWLVESELAAGYADGTFRPTAPVSRQAAAAFLYRAANDGADAPACTEAAFTDVPVSSEFCGEIAWMVEENITTGYEDDTFRPTAAVSRQAMAAFLFRTAPVG